MSKHWSGGVIQVSSLTPNSDIHRMFGTKISTASSKTGAKFMVALILACELTCHVSKKTFCLLSLLFLLVAVVLVVFFNTLVLIHLPLLDFFVFVSNMLFCLLFFLLLGSSLAASLAVRVQRSMRSARCQALRSRLPTLWKARLTDRSP